MKKYIIILIVSILLLTSCNSNNNKKDPTNTNPSTGKKEAESIIYSKVKDKNGIYSAVVLDLDGNEIKSVELGKDDFIFPDIETKNYVVITIKPSLMDPGKFGVINSKGVITVEPSFDGIVPIEEGFSLAVKNDVKTSDGKYLYSIINSKGELIADSKYSTVVKVKDGNVVVESDGIFGVIDSEGKEVLPMEYSLIVLGTDGIYAATKKGQPTEFLDSNFNKILDSPYALSRTFSSGLAPVKKDATSKVGFIDKTGKLVIDFTYDEVLGFSGDFSPVLVGEKWGLINKKGEMVIEPQYSGMEENEDNYIVLEKLEDGALEPKIGFINKEGDIVVEPTLDSVPLYLKEGMASIYNDETFTSSLLNIETNKIYLDNKISRISDFRDGVAVVTENSGALQVKVIDKEGKELFDSSEYLTIGSFTNGIAPAQKNVDPESKNIFSFEVFNYGFVDKKGNFTEFNLKDKDILELSNIILLDD